MFGKRKFRLIVLLLYFVDLFAGQVIAQEGNNFRPLVNLDYRELLKECGQNSGRYGVGFLKFSKGLWPIPSTMTVMDSVHGYLEYGDGDYPWLRIRPLSHMLLTDGVGLAKNWEWAITKSPDRSYSRCGLTVTTYHLIDEVGVQASIVTDQREYLLMLGPVADSVDAGLQCYVETLPRVGATCK